MDVDTDNQRKAISVGNDVIDLLKETVLATDNIIKDSSSKMKNSLGNTESYQESLDIFKTILTQRSALERDYLVELAEQDRVNQLILEREKENIEEQQKQKSIEDSVEQESVEEKGKKRAREDSVEQENVEEKGKKRAREDSEEQEGPENKKQKTDQGQQSQGSGSLVEDFADTSLEMPSYTDPED
ncbi:MAG: hypothetical protein DI529_14115 [Chryseobacterium sp.]|nr:MAG: hypothetical protein DI529_14115 [Chryseobacterium sp.]